MADYQPNEIVDMIMVLGECNNNYRAAARLYAARFPDRRHPRHTAISRLTQRARDGHMVRQRRHHVYDVNDARCVTVLAIIHVDPHISSRRVEKEHGIPRRTFLRILETLKYHAYHITLVQELQIHHFQQRLVFCQWALHMIENDQNFFNFVLFSDEATFQNDGELNRHNCHYWSNENPHWHRTVNFQRRWSLMVWCGIVNGYLIGPYFFEENVNRLTYLQLIREQLPELMEDVDLETRRRLWLQQDGAPPHFALIVRHFLNENYNGRWIGRGGPVNWPACSPDLTSLDFFLWGYLKNVVFEQRPTTKANMQDRIRRACAAIPRQTLLDTVRHFQRRLILCLEANGGHFEHLLRG